MNLFFSDSPTVSPTPKELSKDSSTPEPDSLDSTTTHQKSTNEDNMEQLKSKVSVNESGQPQQKLIIDVSKPTTTTSSDNAKSARKKSSNAAEKRVKREISLVLEPTPKKCSGFVGFANLPNQVYRKAVKKGFDFTLMVVGESGLGKSTLINSMFLTDIYQADSSTSGMNKKLPKTLNISEETVKMVENEVQLSLTVVDTPGTNPTKTAMPLALFSPNFPPFLIGFGDAVNNDECWTPVINHVEKQFDKYLDAETRVERFPVPDSRVHACLYFIAPSGHGLKPLDIEFMRRIHQRVSTLLCKCALNT